MKFGLNKPIKSDREHDHDANKEYDLLGINSEVTHEKTPSEAPLERNKSMSALLRIVRAWNPLKRR